MQTEEFAICMKQNMEKKKISLQNLSELTGISISRLEEYESGVFVAKSDEIISIGKALGVPPVILMKGGGNVHFSSLDEDDRRICDWEKY